jgi:hypothetical protein
MLDSSNLTIRDNWFDPIVGGGNGQSTSYGLRLSHVSSSLFENNIFNGVESPITPAGPMTGNVFGYNYENRNPALEPLGVGGIQPHGVGAAMNLFEGNYAFVIYADVWHGSSALNTIFRNYTFGSEVGVDLWAYSRWYNVIGNVIAANSVYKSSCTDATAYSRWDGVAIRLGYASQYNTCSTQNNPPSHVFADPVVTASTMLWGNYAAAGASPRWLPSEVPTNDPVFPNTLPASQTLPASFYYTARPSWWPTSKAWPPIGPDVTGGTNLAGHAYTLPAGDCFTAAGGNMANFKPATCYASGSSSVPTPTAPTNLRIIR